MLNLNTPVVEYYLNGRKILVKRDDLMGDGDILPPWGKMAGIDALLENLQDEETKDGDHPKLWKNFAMSVGASENEIEKVKPYNFTKEMIDNFFVQARKSYAEGLASLYTYERQIPEIAETKIQGLKKYYGVNSKEGLEFFETHKSADVIHRAECEKLLDNLSKEEQKKAEKASIKTAQFLWNFLSGMISKHNLKLAA